MAFSQTTITSVNPPVYTGFQVYLSWTCSSPSSGFGVGGYAAVASGSAAARSGSRFTSTALAWWGQTTTATLILGSTGPIRVDIGTVLPGEEQTDFSADLPASPARRANLSWLGGTFESIDIAGFRVYGSDSAGGSVDMTTVLADITAYPSGIMTDGFGLRRIRVRRLRRGRRHYTWTSEPLTDGTWSYAIVPYDDGRQPPARSRP